MKEPELLAEDALRSGYSYSGDSDWWDHTYVKTEWPPAEVRVKQETELSDDSQCRKVASECADENAGWSHTRVKQDPSCGVSEPAIPAGMYVYIPDAVKDELVPAPKRAQPSQTRADSAGPRGVSEAAVLAGLYTDHAVKDELVLGPEGVQHPSLLDALRFSNWSVTLKQEPPDSPETLSSRDFVLHDAMITNTQTDHEIIRLVDEEVSEYQFDRNKTVEETLYDGCSDELKLKRQWISNVAVHILNDSESGFADDGKNASNVASVMQPRRQPTLRECFVRLERIPHHDVLLMQTTARRSRVDYDARGSPHTGGNSYVCDSCGKTYEQKRKLIRHIELHTRRRNPKKSNNIHGRVKSCRKPCGMCSQSNGCKCKPYMCDTCGKRFKQSCHLARHSRIHTGTNRKNCDICNKIFTRLNNLRDHKRIHSEQKLYPCEICNKQFSYLRSLKAHKQIHTGLKPFMCDICKMRFARLDNVNRHKRTHTGETSYSCQICKKEFTRLSNFKEHKRIHTGQKPYSCDVCKRRFTRLSSLSSHERNFHMPDKS